AWVALWFWPLDADRDLDASEATEASASDDAEAAHLTSSRSTAANGEDGGDAARSSRWVRPPNWNEWLTVLEELIGAEPSEPTGQLDLFADLEALAEVEARRAAGRASVAELKQRHPWL